MAVTAVAAVGLGLLLDALFAEVPSRVHPVVLFGRVVDRTDRGWRHPRLVGAAVAVTLPLFAGVLAWAVVRSALAVGPVAVTVVAGLALFTTTSFRMLIGEARRVVRLSEADPDRARSQVPSLVGRDPTTLSPADLRSAAVESVAENLADGLVAPLLAFAIGTQVSLAVGVAAAVWVKAVNTLDSMLGYPSKPVGTASARLDDVVMWVPARVTAVLLAVAGRSPRAVDRGRSWARRPPSPNSGWPMATLGAVLDVRLEKPGAYVLNPAADPPSIADAETGIRVAGGAGVLAIGLTGVAVWC